MLHVWSVHFVTDKKFNMRRQTKHTISRVYSFHLVLRSVTFEGGGGEGVRLMSHVENHCWILKTLTDFCQIEYMSFYYMSLHAEAFMQHELAMRLQLLAPKILVLDLSRQRRISEVIKNRRQQKRKRRPLHAGRKSTVRLQHRPPPRTIYNGKWPPPRTAKLQLLSNYFIGSDESHLVSDTTSTVHYYSPFGVTSIRILVAYFFHHRTFSLSGILALAAMRSNLD